VNGLWSALDRFLGPLVGRLETPGQVKRRMLVISLVAAIAASGAYTVTRLGPDPGPFNAQELRDMSGLPAPPVRFVQDADGTFRTLNPEELEQLRQLQELIRNFPAQNFGEGVLPQPPTTTDSTDRDGGG
jgi:hypothetical protein